MIKSYCIMPPFLSTIWGKLAFSLTSLRAGNNDGITYPVNPLLQSGRQAARGWWEDKVLMRDTFLVLRARMFTATVTFFVGDPVKEIPAPISLLHSALPPKEWIFISASD